MDNEPLSPSGKQLVTWGSSLGLYWDQINIITSMDEGLVISSLMAFMSKVDLSLMNK